MYGSNVNLKFQEELKKHSQETLGESRLDIVTCTLYKSHTSFMKGTQKLPIDIDQFAVDLQRFFNLSNARRVDCTNPQECDVSMCFTSFVCKMVNIEICSYAYYRTVE